MAGMYNQAVHHRAFHRTQVARFLVRIMVTASDEDAYPLFLHHSLQPPESLTGIRRKHLIDHHPDYAGAPVAQVDGKGIPFVVEIFCRTQNLFTGLAPDVRVVGKRS